MNHKTNLKKILDHKQGDHLAIDFGATAVTGMHVLCVKRLREFYGLSVEPIKVIEPFQMLGEIDQELQTIMGVNVVGSLGIDSFFGLKAQNYKLYKTIWGQEVLVPGLFNTISGEDGYEYIYPQGDTSVDASGKMPSSGYFFDAVIRQEPINEENLDPEDNLEEFSLLTNAEIEKYKKIVDELSKTQKGIIMSFGGSALGDIAVIPGTGLLHPKGIRDITEWYMSTVIRPDYIHKVFEKQTEMALENFKNIFEKIGNSFDSIFICGTDFGTQNSQFCSKESFDSLYLPYYKRMNDWIHTNTEWKTFKHTCGAIEPLIPNLINAGFDIINPVQFSAAGMDTQTLKNKYGKDIVFWGGGVNTQKTLPFGKPEQVRKEVLEQCEILSKDGGFVFNSVHNIQANTPIENVVAMIDALKEFNK